MKIKWAEARELIDEIVAFLSERGCDLDLNFKDYEDLDNLVYSKDNHTWVGSLQQWVGEGY